jgi:HAD superfamily hydrolase (TIGR01509 family)
MLKQNSKNKNLLAIFDLDGTLFDTRMVNYLSYNKALSQYHAEIDYDYFADYCNGRKYTVFLPSIIEEKYMDEVHSLKKRYYKEFLSKAIENKHLFNIIEKIKSEYHIALVTTASKENADDILCAFGKKDLFELIITQEDVSKPKPDPEGFFAAMHHFNIKSEDTIIFEDSEVGIIAAQQTGGKVIVIKGYA